MIEANLWWAAWIIKEVSSYSTYPFIAFLLCSFLPFPLQSCCQPATSSGAAMAASWLETAPSVSALTALRSGRTGRAAEVGSCTAGGGLLPWNASPYTSLLSVQVSPFALGQTSFSWSRSCWLYENHLPAGRASCTAHHSTDTWLHIYPYTWYKFFALFYVLHGVWHRTWFCYSCTELFEFCT